MATQKTDTQFKEIVETVTQDRNVLAFWIEGSRGKGMVTKNSDYDARMIVKNNVLKKYKHIYEHNGNPEIEISVMTLSAFKKYATYGTAEVWDRYNFAHLKVTFDRTGRMQALIDQKPRMTAHEQKTVISGSIDAFINHVYRSLKCVRDEKQVAARFKELESISCFLDAIFALEGRVKPYYEYLAWELDQYPLKRFPWNKGELMKKLNLIITRYEVGILLELLKTILPIFKSAGFGPVFDGWKGYYKVSE